MRGTVDKNALQKVIKQATKCYSGVETLGQKSSKTSLSWSFTNKSKVALTNSIDKKVVRYFSAPEIETTNRHSSHLTVTSYLRNNCESGPEIRQTDCIDTDVIHVDGSPRCFYDPE